MRMLITDVESAVGSIDGQNADQLVNVFSLEVQSQLNSAIQRKISLNYECNVSMTHFFNHDRNTNHI